MVDTGQYIGPYCDKIFCKLDDLVEVVKVPVTPNLHIIFEHLPEYFELTGKTLNWINS